MATGADRSRRSIPSFNHYPAKINNVNFQPLDAVYRYRDPQLHVAEND